MEYQFKYNERPRFAHEELYGDEDIPSAKAVQDTAVEERNGKVVKSRRQSVCGREYIVLAEFRFRRNAVYGRTSKGKSLIWRKTQKIISA